MQKNLTCAVIAVVVIFSVFLLIGCGGGGGGASASGNPPTTQPDDNPVDQPETPDNPSNPSKPDNPANPTNPQNPDTPINPDNPSDPGGDPAAQLFPHDNIWNVPVDSLPLDPSSAQYITTIGSTRHVHADFGSGTWNGGPIGIPFMIIPGNQARVSVTFYYPDESDPGPYPIPANASIEGGPDAGGDRHVILWDQNNSILYELYDAHPQSDGSWTAGSGAVYDTQSHALRPAGWTSADAAGLPILPGLARYDEVASGEINHALRFTAPQTRREYIWPARHFASSLPGGQYPPMGQRFRLRADFDETGYSRDSLVIIRCLKKYGMILADNGSSWYISGAPDERWNNDVLHELDVIAGSDFEAVDCSSLMISPDSGQARTGN